MVVGAQKGLQVLVELGRGLLVVRLRSRLISGGDGSARRDHWSTDGPAWSGDAPRQTRGNYGQSDARLEPTGAAARWIVIRCRPMRCAPYQLVFPTPAAERLRPPSAWRAGATRRRLPGWGGRWPQSATGGLLPGALAQNQRAATQSGNRYLFSSAQTVRRHGGAADSPRGVENSDAAPSVRGGNCFL